MRDGLARAAMWSIGCLILLAAPGLAPPARAQVLDAADCDAAAVAAEQAAGLPAGLLRAIGRVETGRFVPATGQVTAWPWSTNILGIDHVFASKAEAVAWTTAQLQAGQQSIDVGCFQINLKYHPDAFASLDAAFDPVANAQYAAAFLLELYRRSAGWQLAAAQYHSSDPALGTPYGQRVFDLLGGAAPSAGAPLVTDGHALRVTLHLPAVAFGIQVILPQWATTAMPAPARRTPVADATIPAVLQMGRSHSFGRRLPVVFTPN